MMSRRAWSQGAAAIVLAGGTSASAQGDEAATLMAASYETNRFKAARFTAELVLAGPRGDRRVRSLVGLSKLIEGGAGLARLSRFSNPPDIAGSATLTIVRPKGADDLWIYLPALHRVRRLVSSNKRDPWVGSEFSLGDVAGHKVSDWRHALSGEANAGGPATIVTSLPATPGVASDTGYSKRVSWVRRSDAVPMRTDFYDLTGALVKRQVATDVQVFATAPGKAQPMRLVMQNLQTNATSTLTLAGFVANGPLSDGDISPAALGG